jgi:serine/threonine protein kinase
MKEKQGQGICSACGIDDRSLPKSLFALPFGTMLKGKYMVGRLLGSGGFGNTYLALDTSLGIPVAIKEFFPRELVSRERGGTNVQVFNNDAAQQYAHGLKKFFEEAQTLARFSDHPGIVTVRDFFHEMQTAYLVMEYVHGITLKELMKKYGGRLSWEMTINIMTPVMDALREVHAVGMLHRDISPDNIFITHTRQVKLLDFGAARNAIGDVSQSLSVILKGGFAPIEQYVSKGKQGPWTDVYAVAATMYLMLTGKVPQPSVERIQDDQLQGLSELGVAISPATEYVMKKALAIHARTRFASIKAFQRALHEGNSDSQVQVKSDVPARSTRSTHPTRPTHPTRRFGFKAIGFTLTLLGAVGLLLFFLMKSPELLKVGDYVEFGKYNKKTIVWRVLNIADDGHTLLLSDRILTLKPFDSSGDKHKEALQTEEGSNRVKYGSNYYLNSNLRQWLNSISPNNGGNTIKWKQNEPNKANVNSGKNAYNQEAGFLSDANFTSAERNLIRKRKHQVLLSSFDRQIAVNSADGEIHKLESPIALDDALQNYDNAFYEWVEDDVFLLSLKDVIQYVQKQSDLLGADFIRGYPTAQAIDKSEIYDNKPFSIDEPLSYWLGTASGEFTSGMLTISSGAMVETSNVKNGNVGVRPALIVDGRSLKLSKEGDGSNVEPYQIEVQSE